MDHQFPPYVPLNSDSSVNNGPDQPINSLPTIPQKGLHSTQRPNTMSMGDINHLIPAQPISTYTSVPGVQHGLAMQPGVLFNSTASFSNNGYHHQKTLMPNTGLLYDKHIFHDENWMQFGFSIDSKNNGDNDISSLDISGQNTSPPEPTTSKKCEWKGCTYPGSFRRDAELMRHIKTVHVSRDAYKCPVCGKAFGRKDKMEDHRRTHIGMERKMLSQI